MNKSKKNSWLSIKIHILNKYTINLVYTFKFKKRIYEWKWNR